MTDDIEVEEIVEFEIPTDVFEESVLEEVKSIFEVDLYFDVSEIVDGSLVSLVSIDVTDTPFVEDAIDDELLFEEDIESEVSLTTVCIEVTETFVGSVTSVILANDDVSVAEKVLEVSVSL